jgi:HSP20 family molecular chaperone IbpA
MREFPIHSSNFVFRADVCGPSASKRRRARLLAEVFPMRRLIHRIFPSLASHDASPAAFRQPRFETHERSRTVDLDVFVPGVQPEHVDLVVDNQDLVVTARKPHAVLRNWQAANFGAVQSDYQLRVHLGTGVDARAIWGVLRDGVLKIHFRRKAARQRLELSVG